ncbi:MAG: hypothetical protein CYG59_09050 [Chloroflexi bacterium]|nr:MAG: hypothetical protein CYG59_09050 [Chloroflexota bacterium]
MTNPASSVPALFRTSDIGVSSEWRDVSYDWSPVLTATGVFVYSYLRDSYDHQRNLRPFLLRPEGPTKKAIQAKLGLKTAFALQGPEYLLATVGLLHVEVVRGAVADPDRPNATNVAYYSVGRLDHPVLDWRMLDRILAALIIAFNEPGADGGLVKKAEAAVRALGQSGMLQNCDPDDLFYPHGSWPSLLATLIYDERWVRLFSQLHGADAVTSYRQQAHVWIQAVQRSAARLNAENDRIRAMMLDAQCNPRRDTRQSSDIGLDSSDTSRNTFRPPATPGESPATSGVKAIQLNQGASVAVMSPATRKAMQLNQGASATTTAGSDGDACAGDLWLASSESLSGDQLTGGIGRRTEYPDSQTFPATGSASDNTTDPSEPHFFAIDEHLRDEEATSTRYDLVFWSAVNLILTGSNDRYDHTPGEKKAAERAFKNRNIPIGAVLAALRALMTLPAAQQPPSFGAALKLPAFHAYLQQAITLLPARLTPRADRRGWFAFLDAYRSQGQQEALRDVSVPDYHTLKAFFDRQPDACWEVLSNIEHAEQPVKLTPRYLRRAVENNLLAQVQHALLPRAQTADYAPDAAATWGSRVIRPDDPRLPLLLAAGMRTSVLQPSWTEAYITAWIREADARAAELKDRVGWIIWGLRSGRLPSDHARLQRGGALQPAAQFHPAHNRQATASGVTEQPGSSEYRSIWESVLSMLKRRIPRAEFDTWISETTLIELGEREAVIGTPNVFAREKLEAFFMTIIEETLHSVLGRPVIVQFVIGSGGPV